MCITTAGDDHPRGDIGALAIEHLPAGVSVQCKFYYTYPILSIHSICVHVRMDIYVHISYISDYVCSMLKI